MAIDDEDWNRIKRLGRHPEIKEKPDYERAFAAGAVEFQEAFAGDYGVIRPSDIVNGHKILFDKIHPWAGKLREKGDDPVIYMDEQVKADNIPEKMQGILEGQISHKESEMTEADSCRMIAEVYCGVVAGQFFRDGNKRLANALTTHQMTAEFGDHPWQEIKRDDRLRGMQEFHGNGKTDIMTGLINDQLKAAIDLKEQKDKLEAQKAQQERADENIRKLKERQIKMKQQNKQKP